MKKISELLIENHYQNLKIRYADWRSIKYISIETVCEISGVAFGYYDNGDPCSFSLSSDFWEVYLVGAELAPSAV